MGIITKEVEVKPTGKMIQYYKDKGYDAKCRQSLIVKIEDLPTHSDIIVEIACDYCKEKVSLVKYSDYTKGINNIEKYACDKCRSEKLKEVTQKLYGVDYIFSVPDIQKNIRNTILNKYNAIAPTCNEVVKNKCRQTTKKHFGVEYPSQAIEIQKKMRQTFYKNGTVPTSCQQMYIYNLYSNENNDTNVKLNYPISRFSADICFINEKLDVEIDFGGHNLQVKLGSLTEEEFKHKEIVRNSIIKKDGYKQMRIVSSKNLLPSDEILLQILEYSRQYFKEYNNRSWIEWNIDTSTVRHAENKEGSYYNFGELRTIKKSDVEEIKESTEKIVA